MKSKFGLTDKDIGVIDSILISYLGKKNQHTIYVFGSRATGKHRQYSDLDLWLDAIPPVTNEDIRALDELFDESNLAIKVDIVSESTCLPEYRERIAKEKIAWV